VAAVGRGEAKSIFGVGGGVIGLGFGVAIRAGADVGCHTEAGTAVKVFDEAS